MRQPLTLYSDNLADVNDIFTALLQAAEKPEKSLAIPLTPSLKVCFISGVECFCIWSNLAVCLHKLLMHL